MSWWDGFGVVAFLWFLWRVLGNVRWARSGLGGRVPRLVERSGCQTGRLVKREGAGVVPAGQADRPVYTRTVWPTGTEGGLSRDEMEP